MIDRCGSKVFLGPQELMLSGFNDYFTNLVSYSSQLVVISALANLIIESTYDKKISIKWSYVHALL